MANIILDSSKSTGVSSTIALNEGDKVVLKGFELSQAQQVFVNELGQLVIVLTDGTQFLLTNFAQMLADNPDNAMIVSENGDEVSYSDVIAKFIDNERTEEVEPALGPDETATAATTQGTGTSISEGSNAAENFDLFGAGFGLGEVVTSETQTAEPEAEAFAATPFAGPDVTPFAAVGPDNNDATTAVVEDTTTALGIPAPTDADSDNNLLTITITALPDAAAGVIQLSGVPITVGQVLTPTELTSLTFIPTTDFNGTATLNYDVTDTTNDTTPSVHTINVTGVADAPVFSGPSSLTVNEDAAATGLNLTIPTDPDTPYGDNLSISITTPLSSIDGTITLDGIAITGSQTFTTAELARLQFAPDANFNGVINFNYSVTDSTSTTVGTTHTITVNAVNDAPTVVASSSTLPEDNPTAALNIPAPTDVEGDAMTITLNALPLVGEGVLTYANNSPVLVGDVLTVAQLTGLQFTPTANYNGSFTINYVVNDGTDTTPGTHTVNITSVNDDPIATNSTSTQAEDTTDVTLAINTPTDVDDTTLLASIAVLPTEGVLKFSNGVVVGAGVDFDASELAGITFTPNADFNGSVVINYSVKDDDGATDTATHTITVTAVNDAPVTTASTSAQDEDTTTIDLNITAPTDVDTGDVLTITIDALPTDGTLYYADGTTPVGGADNLTVAQLTGLKFTPNANYNGTVAINYTVGDGTTTTGGTHTITVNAVKDAPIVTNSTSTQAEDTTDITLGINTPTDADGDTLFATISTLPTDGTLKFAGGAPVPANTAFLASELAGITFTPNANFNGNVVINYTITDNNTTPVAGAHTVTVTNVPDAPIVVNSTSSQDEDSTAVGLGIPAPTDPDNDSLTIITALPADGTLYHADGTTAVGVGESLTVAQLTGLKFTPNANFNGTVVISYTVSDGDGSTADTAGTHTITVNAINDAPDVTNSTSTQAEDSVDGALGIPLPTDVEGEPMQFRITSVSDGVLKLGDGTVIVPGTLYSSTLINGVTFTPNADFNGTVTVQYEVTDGTDTTPGTHTITITGTNDAPVVTNSTSSQDEDSSAIDLGITAPTDPENDSLTTIAVLPTDGTLYHADGTTPVGVGESLTVAQLTSLKFTPNADFNGTVVINYTVSDGSLTTPGTHTITVNAVNDAPVITNSSSSQTEDSSNIVLGIPLATDVDGDALRFTVGTLPTDGTFTFVDGSPLVAGVSYDIADIANLRFSPSADFNGSVVLNYTVTDSNSAPVAGTHTITVTPVNDAPVATNSTSSQDEDTTATIGITMPTDVDGDALFATIATLPTDGILKFADGSLVQAGIQFNATELPNLTFEPNLNYNGSVAINYTVTDTLSAPVSATHVITVNPVADSIITLAGDLTDPDNQVDFSIIISAAEVKDCVASGTYSISAEYQYNTVVAGSGYNYTLPANTFVSSDGSPLTYSATYTYNGVTTAVPTSGANWVTINPANGNLTGSFPASMVGLITFAFTATSPEGLTSSKAITYNVMTQSQFSQVNVVGPRYGDYLLPNDGKDNLMIGMGDNDILKYDLSNTGTGIIANLEKGYIDKQNGHVDLADGFREIIATNYSDTITAENGAYTIVRAAGGNDTVVSSTAGDYLDGGSGTDTLSYASATSGVTVNLANGSNSVGDTLVSFENLTGSAHNDTLTGSAGNNVIDGGAGADIINAGAGNDTVIFDSNDISVDGGAGYDSLVVTAANTSTGNNIDLSQVTGGTITVTGIEEINMENGVFDETLHMNVADLLFSAENNEIRIKGDRLMDFKGALKDEVVQMHDKTTAEIQAADTGTKTIDGTRYDVYDFGSEGTLYVEFGLDILDSSGNHVM